VPVSAQVSAGPPRVSVWRRPVEASMPMPRRPKLVLTVALVLAALTWLAVLPELLSASTALWITLAIALIGFVAVKFHRHVETPDSMHLT